MSERWKVSRRAYPETDKRLTGPELAAEFYRAHCEVFAMKERYYEVPRTDIRRASEIATAINRFATLPHYDEAGA